jgi:hypothetical protein
MLVPDFAALRYFFYYRFPDALVRKRTQRVCRIGAARKNHRVRKCLQCNEECADRIRRAWKDMPCGRLCGAAKKRQKAGVEVSSPQRKGCGV